jgi:hypothetical protein
MLVIRAWIEEGSSSPLRARVRSTTDVRSGSERNLTAVDVDAVLANVGEWLEELLAAGPDGGDAGPEPGDPDAVTPQ